MRAFLSLFIIVLSTSFFVGCKSEGVFTAAGDGLPEDPPEVELVQLQATPSDVSLPKGFTQTLSVTAVYSDDTSKDVTRQVSWGSLDPGVAVVSGVGVLNAVDVGETLITATLDDVTSNNVVSKVKEEELISIQNSPGNVALANGLESKLAATGTFSDSSQLDISQTVQWESADTSIAEISDEGLITGVNVGQTVISSHADGVTGNDVVVEVGEATLSKISLTPRNVTLPQGGSVRFSATGILSDGTSVDITPSVFWGAEDPSLVSINSEGLLNATNTGSTAVYANKEVVSSERVDVTVIPAVLEAIELSEDTVSLPEGVTTQLKATGVYSDGSRLEITSSVAWFSADPDVATVVLGKLSAVDVGSTFVTASQGGIDSSQAQVEVSNAVLESITIEPRSVALAKGNSASLEAKGEYSNGEVLDITEQVSWIPEDSHVASVYKGLVTGLNTGNTNVVAVAANRNVVSEKATISVTCAVVKDIEVRPESVTIADGQSASFTAKGIYSDGTEVDLTSTAIWGTTDSAVVVVQDGRVSAEAAGNAFIEAELDSVTSNKASVNVTDATLSLIKLTPGTVTLAEGSTKQMEAMAIYSNGDVGDVTSSVSWFVGNSDLASISRDGVLEGVAVGMTTLTAQDDGVSSNAVSVNVTEAPFVLSVCGHVKGTPVDTSPDGGIDNADRSNAAGECLKIREVFDSSDGRTKWFTSTPSVPLLDVLSYTISDNPANSGSTYAAVTTENGINGPSGKFGRFRQDGSGVVLPGAGNNDEAGKSGQLDRWCQKLSDINFAQRSNWRRPTAAELLMLYSKSGTDSMFERFGWPVSSKYWTADPADDNFTDVWLLNGKTSSLAPQFNRYVSCVSDY